MAESDADFVQLAKLRLGWAARTIQSFHDGVQAFLDTDPFELAAHADSDWYVIRFHVRKDIPKSLSFLAADAVHNLRAVVDNLVWGVGQLHGASANLAMEFRDTRTKYDRWFEANKVGKLPVALQKWLLCQQLFSQPGGLRSRLHRLNKLWNADKHRLPMLMGGAMAAGNIASTGNIEARMSGIFSPLEDGDEVMAFRAIDGGDATLCPKFTVDVAFDKNTNPQQSDLDVLMLDRESGSARLFLWNTHRYIREEVLPVFESLGAGCHGHGSV